MTDHDEERKKLCAELRNADLPDQPMCDAAADEIEQLASELKREECESEHYVRLAFIDAGANPAMTWKQEAERLAALAQSDAEPIAWRWRYKGPWPWTFVDDKFSVRRLSSHNEIEVEPLYTAPPRPAASAGLIEAAEELADLMDDVVQGNYKPDTFTTQPLRKALRATDRSGK